MVNLKNLWWEEEVNEKYQILKKFNFVIMVAVVFLHLLNVLYIKDYEALIKNAPYNLAVVLQNAFIWLMERRSMNIKSSVALIVSELNGFAWYSMWTNEVKQMRTLLATLSFASIYLYEWPFLESFWARNLILIKNLIMFNYNDLLEDNFLFTSFFPQMTLFLIFLLCELNWRNMKKNSYEKFLSRKNIENAEKRIQLIFKLFPDGILIISQKKEILFSNENLLKLLNCDLVDVMNVISSIDYCPGKKYSNLTLSNKLIDDINSVIGLQINEEKLLGICEINNHNLEWKSQKVLWNESEVILLTLRNVSNIIQLEKSVSDNNLKNIILRSVSHELRTPVNAIATIIEALKEEPEIKKSKDWSEKLSIAMVSSELLLSLINDLLDYSKILAGVFSIQKSNILLKDALNSAIQLIKLQLEKKGLNLFLRIDPELPAYICTDALRFNQILLNLLSNALKFTVSGYIEVTCVWCANGKMKIIVQDTGVGMKENKLKDLFREFSTHNKSLNPTGCGLGLFISNIISKELGSKCIKVESKYKQGSIFSFKIDVFEEEIRNEVASNENIGKNIDEDYVPIKIKDFSSNIEERYPNVLIVDDNEFNRIALGSLLASNNISCHEACTGSQAVELVKMMDKRKRAYKLVVMDGSMPDLNGWEATSIIQELYSQGIIEKLPTVIGYTAFTSGQDIKTCLDAGMKECIPKPCNPKQLLSKISHYLLL